MSAVQTSRDRIKET